MFSRTPMPPSLSLITCTRDPRADLLARVLAAVAGLKAPPGEVVEHLLIDSASDPPLAARPDLRDHVDRHPGTRIIRADAPGHALARRIGVREAAGRLLIWFDDDNVPAPAYLEQAVATERAHPDVTVWGAGRISVEFVDAVPAWVERTQRATFQERAHPRDEYGSSRAWASFFPVGSGMVTRREAMQRWAEATDAGRYTLAGRRAGSLGSGDDAQIIFGAIADGGLVGVSAAMALTHLIPASRGTLRYLARLEYALAASLRVARAECFPDDPSPASPEGLGSIRASRAVVARLVRDGGRAAILEAARRLGARRGARDAARLHPGLSRR